MILRWLSREVEGQPGRQTWIFTRRWPEAVKVVVMVTRTVNLQVDLPSRSCLRPLSDYRFGARAEALRVLLTSDIVCSPSKPVVQGGRTQGKIQCHDPPLVIVVEGRPGR